MQISGSIRCCLMTTAVSVATSMKGLSAEAHVLEIDRLAVDADRRRGDPVGELAGLDDASHQRRDEGPIFIARQPLALVRLPLSLVDYPPVGRHADAGERADLAVERLVRHDEALRQPGL